MIRLMPGVKLECYGLPIRQAVARAAKAGAKTVQFDAVGELAPARLSETGRRELFLLLRSYNLSLAAVYCPLRKGLDSTDDQEPRLAKVQRVMDLSFDLGARLVTLHAGAIPLEKEGRGMKTLEESMGHLALYGDRKGTAMALITGNESGKVLREFLGKFDSGSLGAAIDPANLQLNGFNPMETARDLGQFIRLVYGREMVRAGSGRLAKEAALGHGDLDWPALLALLHQVDFHGSLVVASESGSRRSEEMAEGLRYIQSLNPSA